MADEFGEKTEPPTQKRRSDLRLQGNVPKSTDLAAVFTIMGAIIPLFLLMSSVRESLYELVDRMLSGDSFGNVIRTDGIFTDLGFCFRVAGIILLPFVLCSFAATAIAMSAQTGLMLTGKPLQPDLKNKNNGF